MKKLPVSTDNDLSRHDSLENGQRATLLQLQRGSWRAAVLLFLPWSMSVLLNWSLFQEAQFRILALLPGFAVALHIHLTLYRNLEKNHLASDEHQLLAFLGAPNWITLWRAAAVVALAGFLPQAIWENHLPTAVVNWMPGFIYLGISLADLLDGMMARKLQRITALGKRLDIETDAAGLLTASLIAVALGRIPTLYLLAGLAYYLFILGIRLRVQRGLPVASLQQRPYGRIIAGFQMGLVAMILLPLFHPIFTHVAAIVFMIPLLLGFIRDWLVVSCRLNSSNDQQTEIISTIDSLSLKKVPLFLRPVILLGGIMTFVDYAPNLQHLSWLLTHNLLCLLATLGFMGRSSCLLLILVLACNQSPFEITIISIVTFGSAALLMLTGTGTMSLWAPEEKILYRRQGVAPVNTHRAP